MYMDVRDSLTVEGVPPGTAVWIPKSLMLIS